MQQRGYIFHISFDGLEKNQIKSSSLYSYMLIIFTVDPIGRPLRPEYKRNEIWIHMRLASYWSTRWVGSFHPTAAIQLLAPHGGEKNIFLPLYYESYDVRRPRFAFSPSLATHDIGRYEIHKATPTIHVTSPGEYERLCQPTTGFPPFGYHLFIPCGPFIFFSPFSSGSGIYHLPGGR